MVPAQPTPFLTRTGLRVMADAFSATDTPSLRKIPGHEEMMKLAKERNPGRRLTTPQDVANAIASLSGPGLEWATGNVISRSPAGLRARHLA